MNSIYQKGIKNLQQDTITGQSYVARQKPSIAEDKKLQYNHTCFSSNTSIKGSLDNTIDAVSKWFLNMSAMSNKKLQKLCYYAYCWFIVFFNDIEFIKSDKSAGIETLWDEHFQAWIHGPVLPSLYNKYKIYGWHDIPSEISKPNLHEDIEELLQEVWDAYAAFSADELETISHEETPWKNARINLRNDEPCSKEISDYDILEYYSNLR